MRAFDAKALGLAVAALLLTACNSGGNITLEPGARKIASKGSADVIVNQGGRALVVEQGQAPSTGVHGWIAVQTVGSKNLTDTDGSLLTINKSSAHR